jgi:two-component system sensor histidine kinase QseC
MNLMPRSLQGRLLALTLGLVASVWMATALLTWADVRHELDELFDAHLAQAAALLVVQQTAGIDDAHEVDAPTLHRYAPKVAFQVFHEGELALRSANAPALPMVPLGEGFQAGFRTVPVEGVDWRVFAAYGTERDVQVYVGEVISSREAVLRAALRGALSPMLVGLPLLVLALWWGVRRAVAPLRRLGRVLAERRPQAVEPVVLDDAPSEMQPMLAALNDLFARINTLLESQQRFTADAAHELRTPIAAIRTQAQVAQGEPDEAFRHHALQATIAGCDRASRLVDQLLTLSQLEAGTMPAAGLVDLAEVVRHTVAELAAQAVRKGQTFELDAPEACWVAADAVLLRVLVRNLVDNAIRYNSARAIVKVSVAQVAGRARMVVEDSGPGLSEAASARLGERFFRVLGTGQSGSGLGWSIVRRIAGAQGAALRVDRSTALGGLWVEVDWPAPNSTAE